MLAGMKRLLLPLLVCASTFALAAPDFRFMGLPWGSSPAQTSAYLEKRDWFQVFGAGPGSELYRPRPGTGSDTCKLTTTYSHARLDSVIARCKFGLESQDAVLAMYRRERDTLIKQLGKPNLSSPSLRYGQPAVAWSQPGGLYMLMPQLDGTLAYIYLAPIWKAEVMADFAGSR